LKDSNIQILEVYLIDFGDFFVECGDCGVCGVCGD